MRARISLVTSALLAISSISSSALAFCRTTTCSPATCQPSAACEHCLGGGIPIYWPGGCTSFSIQVDGSPLSGISADQTYEIVKNGLSKWISVDCGGGSTPGMHVFMTNPINIECHAQEYNQDAPNANVWMYRDDGWPYPSSLVYALTSLTYNVETGEIYDADVEINSTDHVLTVGDQNIEGDLDALLTHEAGHFFGLAHSCDEQATMYPDYTPGTIDFRTLGDDDIAGMCEIYPPGSEDPTCDPTPRHGFSTCAASSAGSGGSGGGTVGGGGSGENTGTTQSRAGKSTGCCTTAAGADGANNRSATLFGIALALGLALLRRLKA